MQKYNSCLETLDLSRNPCCGPSLDGVSVVKKLTKSTISHYFVSMQVTSLRTAFTLNTSLKRLFLSATALTSAGAIALAEFLPESQSLFHLDLTQNPALDMAGIVALNAGLKKNLVVRCLDLNIPPDNEELARFAFIVYE
jgi:protein phosphatase 1 regulatory subunit 37